MGNDLWQLKVGDWVIANPKAYSRYTWDRVKIDTPYKIVHIVYHALPELGTVRLEGLSYSYDLVRFLPYKSHMNTKLLSGGNI
jgi:hypothetical protein